jgi:hypothetical protein
METSGWIGLAILVTFVAAYLYLTIRRRMPSLERPEDRVSTAALADVEQNRAQNSSPWAGGGGGDTGPI